MTRNNVDILSNATVGTFTVDGALTVSGSGTFTGICYAQQFVTLSDVLAKSSITKWTGSALDGINKIHPYTFSYTDSATLGSTVGLLAQEVISVWPELVQIGVKEKYVNYDGIVSSDIPLLVDFFNKDKYLFNELMRRMFSSFVN